MYMVPNMAPAPSAAMMPTATLPGASEWLAVATARIDAPPTMANAPPNTFDHSLIPEPRSSLKSSQPQNRPTRLFVFHSGKAMARPTLRTAKMVSVLPTAQSIPAITAHTIRCGLSRRSAKRNPVPLSSVGTVQRATNAPITMPMEMRNGENPAFTSLVGASAVPSQTAAASPQKTPSLCRERVDRPPAGAKISLKNSPQRHKKGHSQDQHNNRNPEMHVSEDGNNARSFHALTSSQRRRRCSSNCIRAPAIRGGIEHS